LEEAVAARVKACGIQAHRALGLRGMSRSDFILRSDGELIFLETNSIPGLTERALLPQAAAAAGIDFTAMISRLVESALR
ncbi:MAG: D-alanine--D-alanine ligase family protein, partial [Planctomycetota bacterium]